MVLSKRYASFDFTFISRIRLNFLTFYHEVMSVVKFLASTSSCLNNIYWKIFPFPIFCNTVFVINHMCYKSEMNFQFSLRRIYAYADTTKFYLVELSHKSSLGKSKTSYCVIVKFKIKRKNSGGGWVWLVKECRSSGPRKREFELIFRFFSKDSHGHPLQTLPHTLRNTTSYRWEKESSYKGRDPEASWGRSSLHPPGNRVLNWSPHPTIKELLDKCKGDDALSLPTSQTIPKPNATPDETNLNPYLKGLMQGFSTKDDFAPLPPSGCLSALGGGMLLVYRQ